VEEEEALPEYPNVPAVRVPGSGECGWTAIDGVPVVDCAYSRFLLRDNMRPWTVEPACAVADILELVHISDPKLQERGLNWWLFCRSCCFASRVGAGIVARPSTRPDLPHFGILAGTVTIVLPPTTARPPDRQDGRAAPVHGPGRSLWPGRAGGLTG